MLKISYKPPSNTIIDYNNNLHSDPHEKEYRIFIETK